MRRTSAFLLLALLSAAPVLARQAPDVPIDGPAPPEPPAVMTRDARGGATVRAMRLPSPEIFDGRLDEAYYKNVPAITDFYQQEPVEGQPATEKTEVWVFFDDENLYVSARLWESDPSRRVTSDMRRDAMNLYNNDHFAVLIDTFYDHRNGYGFATNSVGALFDWAVTNEQPSSDFNTLWDVRAADFDGGWSVEYQIPFRSIRFREGGTVWGMNFRRMVRAKNEVSHLTPVPSSYGRRGMSVLSTEATVVGMAAPGRMRNLDVKPYVLGSVATNRDADVPFENQPNAEFGADVKWGLTQTIVADFTYNTDFAQVEDDEAQVNLTRFSLFFPEKRDFFLEGQEAFAFGGANLRGGGGGRGGGGFNGPDDVPVLFYSRRIGLDNGAVIPIIGGARILGRQGGWQIGALSMQTKDAPEVDVSSTNFSAFRLNRDILSRSRIGVIATRRDPASGIDGANMVVGADAQLNLRDDLTMIGYWSKTDTPGVSGDDMSYRARFDLNGDRYGLQADHLLVGENFNPEVGFLRREAFRRSYGLARFSPRPGRMGIRKIYYQASYNYVTNPAGDVESKEAQGTVRAEMDNSDQISVEYTRSFEAIYEPFDVAKGVEVPAGLYDFSQVQGQYMLGNQRPISGSIILKRGSFYAGNLTELTWRGRVDFNAQFYVEPTLSWNKITGPFGDGNSNLVSTRLTYTLTPRMYVGALVQYQSRADSVATNARFRWEYKPGSELFVVYSDGRSTLTTGFPEVRNQSFVVKITRLLRF